MMIVKRLIVLVLIPCLLQESASASVGIVLSTAFFKMVACPVIFENQALAPALANATKPAINTDVKNIAHAEVEALEFPKASFSTSILDKTKQVLALREIQNQIDHALLQIPENPTLARGYLDRARAMIEENMADLSSADSLKRQFDEAVQDVSRDSLRGDRKKWEPAMAWVDKNLNDRVAEPLASRTEHRLTIYRELIRCYIDIGNFSRVEQLLGELLPLYTNHLSDPGVKQKCLSLFSGYTKAISAASKSPMPVDSMDPLIAGMLEFYDAYANALEASAQGSQMAGALRSAARYFRRSAQIEKATQCDRMANALPIPRVNSDHSLARLHVPSNASQPIKPGSPVRPPTVARRPLGSLWKIDNGPLRMRPEDDPGLNDLPPQPAADPAREPKRGGGGTMPPLRDRLLQALLLESMVEVNNQFDMAVTENPIEDILKDDLRLKSNPGIQPNPGDLIILWSGKSDFAIRWFVGKTSKGWFLSENEGGKQEVCVYEQLNTLGKTILFSAEDIATHRQGLYGRHIESQIQALPWDKPTTASFSLVISKSINGQAEAKLGKNGNWNTTLFGSQNSKTLELAYNRAFNLQTLTLKGRTCELSVQDVQFDVMHRRFFVRLKPDNYRKALAEFEKKNLSGRTFWGMEYSILEQEPPAPFPTGIATVLIMLVLAAARLWGEEAPPPTINLNTSNLFDTMDPDPAALQLLETSLEINFQLKVEASLDKNPARLNMLNAVIANQLKLPQAVNALIRIAGKKGLSPSVKIIIEGLLEDLRQDQSAVEDAVYTLLPYGPDRKRLMTIGRFKSNEINTFTLYTTMDNNTDGPHGQVEKRHAVALELSHPRHSYVAQAMASDLIRIALANLNDDEFISVREALIDAIPSTINNWNDPSRISELYESLVDDFLYDRSSLVRWKAYKIIRQYLVMPQHETKTKKNLSDQKAEMLPEDASWIGNSYRYPWLASLIEKRMAQLNIFGVRWKTATQSGDIATAAEMKQDIEVISALIGHYNPSTLETWNKSPLAQRIQQTDEWNIRFRHFMEWYLMAAAIGMSWTLYGSRASSRQEALKHGA